MVGARGVVHLLSPALAQQVAAARAAGRTLRACARGACVEVDSYESPCATVLPPVPPPTITAECVGRWLQTTCVGAGMPPLPELELCVNRSATSDTTAIGLRLTAGPVDVCVLRDVLTKPGLDWLCLHACVLTCRDGMLWLECVIGHRV